MRFKLLTVLLALVAVVAVGGLISQVPNSNLSFNSGHDCAINSTSQVIDYGTDNPSEPTLACANNFSGTGWDLFSATKHRVEGTGEYPTGFVCRIDDFPPVATENCATIPDAKRGHWAYFYATADSGSTWHYSLQGAATRKPKCGDWDGWRYLLPGEDPVSNPPREAAQPYRCK